MDTDQPRTTRTRLLPAVGLGVAGLVAGVALSLSGIASAATPTPSPSAGTGSGSGTSTAPDPRHCQHPDGGPGVPGQQPTGPATGSSATTTPTA